MQRVPLFLRVAVLFSSTTLLAGFVALKAGLFVKPGSTDRQTTESPSPTQVVMPGSKSVPLDSLPRSIGTGDGKSGIKVPPELLDASWNPTEFHSFSTKSAVPLVEPDNIILPTDLSSLTSPPSKSSTPVMMDSTKRAVPLLRVELPSSDKGPAKTIAPQTMLPGSKSFAPMIEIPHTSPPNSAKPRQTMSKGKGD